MYRSQWHGAAAVRVWGTMARWRRRRMHRWEGGSPVDPVSLILAAMVAGASSGAGEVAGAAVKDAYQGLKELLLRKVRGVPAGEIAVQQYEDDPQTWKAPLEKAVAESGASTD